MHTKHPLSLRFSYILCLVTLLGLSGCQKEASTIGQSSAPVSTPQMSSDMTETTDTSEITDTAETTDTAEATDTAETPDTTETTETTDASEMTEPAYLADPEYPIALYTCNYDTDARDIITEFETAFQTGSDIKTFNVFLSQDESIPGTSFGEAMRTSWNSYYNLCPNASDYRFGYHMIYTLVDGSTLDRMVLGPEDVQNWREYVEVYLYDAIHQTGWYSHLEPGQMEEETLITSVKFTAGAQASEVLSITLTVFWYNSEDDYDLENCQIRTDNQHTLTILNTSANAATID